MLQRRLNNTASDRHPIQSEVHPTSCVRKVFATNLATDGWVNEPTESLRQLPMSLIRLGSPAESSKVRQGCGRMRSNERGMEARGR